MKRNGGLLKPPNCTRKQTDTSIQKHGICFVASIGKVSLSPLFFLSVSVVTYFDAYFSILISKFSYTFAFPVLFLFINYYVRTTILPFPYFFPVLPRFSFLFFLASHFTTFSFCCHTFLLVLYRNFCFSIVSCLASVYISRIVRFHFSIHPSIRPFPPYLSLSLFLSISHFFFL